MSRRRRWIMGLLVLGLLIAVMVGLIVQQRLIYGARSYPPEVMDHLPPGVEAIRFRTAQGQQVAFYRPPTSGRAPERLWLVCYGSSNLALGWVPLVAEVDDPDAGWLLLDYPGFGFCEGRSTPGRILASSAAAVAALRLHLGLAPEAMTERLGVLGYSLGTGAALQYAARHPVRRLVLIAPFTSLAEMGDQLHGWPCGQLLAHRFDNAARLDEIARQDPRPTLRIFHGQQDECIPPAMSAHLQAAHPAWIVREVIPDADHTRIVGRALRRLATTSPSSTAPRPYAKTHAVQ